ncbi:MAG: hypothetical protein ACFFD4_35460 [Candidatus Odinarchaeota archaeon]
MTTDSLRNIIFKFFDHYQKGSIDDIVEFVFAFFSEEEDYEDSIPIEFEEDENIVEAVENTLNNLEKEDYISKNLSENKYSIRTKKKEEILKNDLLTSTLGKIRIRGVYECSRPVEFKKIAEYIQNNPFQFGTVHSSYIKELDSLFITWKSNSGTVHTQWGSNRFFIHSEAYTAYNAEILIYSHLNRALGIEGEILKIPPMASAYFLFSYIKAILLEEYKEMIFSFDEIVELLTREDT